MVWYLVVDGAVILVVTLLDLKCDFSVLSLSHCVTIYFVTCVVVTFHPDFLGNIVRVDLQS